MKKDKLVLDAMIIGLALFATFFGAGNLIFPPLVGFMGGEAWISGAIGLVLTGVILPVLGVIAISNSGTDCRCLMVHAHPKFYFWSCLGGWGVCAMCSTMPKVAATTHEIGIQPIFENLPIEVTIVLFFVITYLFSRQQDSVIDKVGKYLTPILVIVMLVILIKGIVDPAGEPAQSSQVENPMTYAMLQGYLIGDLTIGLMASGLFVNALRIKGYSTADTRKGLWIVGLVCIVIMGCIYIGLAYVGAQGASYFDADVEQTALLSGMVNVLLGKPGQIMFGIVVALACLTTGISIITGIVTFFHGVFKGKVSYNVLLLIACVIGAVLARTGVSFILALVVPIFAIIYPPFIVFTILGLFDKYVPNDGIYKGSVFTALLFGIFDAIVAIFPSFTALPAILSYVPLYSAGFGWVIPSIIVAIICGVIYKDKPRARFDLETETVVYDTKEAKKLQESA